MVLLSLLNRKAAAFATSSGLVSDDESSAGNARVLNAVFTIPGINPLTLIDVDSISSARISMRVLNPAFDTPYAPQYAVFLLSRLKTIELGFSCLSRGMHV